MIILGLDVSSVNTGWSVSDDYKILDYGNIVKDKKKPDIGNTLVIFEKSLCDIINKYHPTQIVAEAPFSAINAKTLQKLCLFHGVLQLVAYKNNIPIEYFAVMQMKKAVLGHIELKKADGSKKTGKELKQEVLKKILDIFGKETFQNGINDDISDSVSAIYTYLQKCGI